MRRARTLLPAAALVGLVAGGATAYGWSSGGGEAVVQAAGAGPGVDPAVVAELTVDGMQPLACGFAPIDVVAAEPGVENADTAESRALREVIASTERSMSPQDGRDWVEMWRGENLVEYGRRTGVVGISSVLGVEKGPDGYTFGGSFGCGPVGYRDGRAADRAEVYVDRGGSLEVPYDGGSCDTRPDEVRVHETDEYVDLLLLRPPPLLEGCVGVGMGRSVIAVLARPVAGRTVRNVGYVPAQVMLRDAEENHAVAGPRLR